MVIVGEYSPSFTGKGRLALPKQIREALENKEIVLSKGFEKCIFGYQKETWEEAAKLELARPISNLEGRDIRRKMFSGAVIVSADEQGRIVIPENLIEYAGITEKAVIVGAGDHFEIWDMKRWQETISRYY